MCGDSGTLLDWLWFDEAGLPPYCDASTSNELTNTQIVNARDAARNLRNLTSPAK